MEPILIYGFPLGSSMGLVAALEWWGRPHRLCRVDMLTEMREPAYARINARHETPVFITDKGERLTETMAIAAWIEARDHERRISFDPLSPQADRMHQLMGFINTGFTASFTPLWAALELDPPDPDLQATLRRWAPAKVIERHDRLEEMAGNGPFLMGDKPTLADAPVHRRGALAGVPSGGTDGALAQAHRHPAPARGGSGRDPCDSAGRRRTAPRDGSLRRPCSAGRGDRALRRVRSAGRTAGADGHDVGMQGEQPEGCSPSAWKAPTLLGAMHPWKGALPIVAIIETQTETTT